MSRSIPGLRLPRRLAGRARDLADELRAAPELGFVLFVIVALPFEFSTDLFSVSWLDVSRVGMVAAIAWFAWRLAHGRVFIGAPARGLLVAVVLVLLVETGSFVLTRWPNAPKEIGALVGYSLFGLAAADALRSRHRLAIATGALLASGFVVGAIGLVEELGNFYFWKDRPLEVLGRRNSTFVDPNITARFYLLCLVVAIAVLAARRLGETGIPSRQGLVAVGATIISTAGGLAYTLSRAGWLIGIVIAVLWASVAVRGRLVLSGLGILAAAATFTLAIVASPSAVSRAGEVPPPESQIEPISTPLPGGALVARTTTVADPLLAALPIDDVRRYLARAGVAMFEDHPVAGVGVGGFQPEILGPYRAFIPPNRQAAPESLEHADVIRVAAETGSVGLAAFVILIAAALLGLWRRAGGTWTDRVTALGLGMLVFVIALSAQTEGRFYTEPYLWLALGAAVAFIGRGPGWGSRGQAGAAVTSSNTSARRPASLTRS